MVFYYHRKRKKGFNISYSEAMAKHYQDKASKGETNMNEDYKKNKFYESLMQLDRLISDLSDEYPDDDIVDDLDNCYQGVMEKYQILYKGLPIAIDKELYWYTSSPCGIGINMEDYEEGYIEGLKAAAGIFKQIRDQY